jgi:hypothetical protein
MMRGIMLLTGLGGCDTKGCINTGLLGFERKRALDFEPDEKTGRQVAAQKKGMGACRLARSLKDHALRLRSYLTSA